MNAEMMGIVPLFRDRAEAGRLLARQLRDYAGDRHVIVLALPRGGAGWT
ncbi:phosphoribosyltransferase [Caballeronia choica]|jgi:putative phosphoribosyl transferase|uniref:Phosphoribosyltransferase n=1 Tax=Caballeronia choica TaxID=326476 RepID=A0A158FEY0_9BURK|nr:phosphoribosyltransferase [Caballeronia choica]